MTYSKQGPAAGGRRPRPAPGRARPVARWAVLALSLAAATSAALAAGERAPVQRSGKAFAALALPAQQLQGHQAVQALGDRLPDVAAWYGRSPRQLRELLTTDRAAWLDRRGRVYFVEDRSPLPPSAGLRAAPMAADARARMQPLDQTFTLHSRPGARRTIYLNFLGASLAQTAWNENRPPIYAEPFSVDNDPQSFSAFELERMQGIWQRVAEAYAAFDVDVTTEPPPPDALSRSGFGDERYGTTALITRGHFMNCGCGGVAYLSAFDDTDDYHKPALVFYDALGGGDEKSVADATVHEVGHNLGLSHDGTSNEGYYMGHGEGATGWAPVMGAGYFKPLVQWSRGEYADANNREDDYAVMASNGLQPTPDDHGETQGTATVLQALAAQGGAAFQASGVIQHPGDRDVFRITAEAGPFSLTVSPAARGAMLDIGASLHDANGTAIAWDLPADRLEATVSANLPYSGTYYLVVDGVGKGDPGGTGYSDYGSIGQFTLAASTGAAAWWSSGRRPDAWGRPAAAAPQAGRATPAAAGPATQRPLR
ncbi:hypothetical protein [Eleftheria terrae]|uniref:hypothetical protein n=1 Tax=Eleftheria terrae TaxID=1597781 RepID=UPI00263BA133|nr:hypothetical protein [Eleftheria terrae]WKB51268.1 hypothetical protein N7L95_15795 [Eleftheria terrae]